MTDRFTIHAVVVGLIVIVLASVGALIYALGVVGLTPEQRGTVLGAIVSVNAGALGGLTAMLVSSRSVSPAQEAAVPAAPVVEAPVEVVPPTG